jgi:hypothetical protein
LARLEFQRTKIAGTEPDQGKRFFGNGGYDQFPDLSGFYGFTGLWIKDI